MVFFLIKIKHLIYTKKNKKKKKKKIWPEQKRQKSEKINKYL